MSKGIKLEDKVYDQVDQLRGKRGTFSDVVAKLLTTKREYPTLSLGKGGAMTLDKAIEILEDLLGEGPQFPPDDRRDAIKLGIAALIRCQFIARDNPIYAAEPLLGETKD